MSKVFSTTFLNWAFRWLYRSHRFQCVRAYVDWDDNALLYRAQEIYPCLRTPNLLINIYLRTSTNNIITKIVIRRIDIHNNKHAIGYLPSGTVKPPLSHAYRSMRISVAKSSQPVHTNKKLWSKETTTIIFWDVNPLRYRNRGCLLLRTITWIYVLLTSPIAF